MSFQLNCRNCGEGLILVSFNKEWDFNGTAVKNRITNKLLHANEILFAGKNFTAVDPSSMPKTTKHSLRRIAEEGCAARHEH